ncbi:hypothetical protein [Streptomyces scabiei]|uniref:hypothetical protein n=1 Tax=Streptomyces scabiei TaxID=1930 RepID=UPI0038F5F2C3
MTETATHNGRFPTDPIIVAALLAAAALHGSLTTEEAGALLTYASLFDLSLRLLILCRERR